MRGSRSNMSLSRPVTCPRQLQCFLFFYFLLFRWDFRARGEKIEMPLASANGIRLECLENLQRVSPSPVLRETVLCLGGKGGRGKRIANLVGGVAVVIPLDNG